jgi:predicted nucleic acid-binding protein
MPDYLLDSCVLIRHLRNHRPTVELIATLALEGQIAISTITRIEIIEGMREHERETTTRLLEMLSTYPLDASVADLAGEYIRRFRQQGITLDMPDAIIGATAVHHNLVLVTFNLRHFPMPGLRCYEFAS